MRPGDRFGERFAAVLVAAQHDEPWALEQIFVTLSPVVAGYLRAQGAYEPDDLTSEVFLGMLRNLSRFRGNEAQFRSWLFTIAHRRLLDERRRSQRRPLAEPLTAADDHAAPDDVEHSVEQTLGAERIRAMCAQLIPDQRDVLLLRWLGRLTVNEVAAVMHRTPGAIKALQRRGLKELGLILERQGVTL
jgi:RNA polymerase sigma factor (sigma-70 family)